MFNLICKKIIKVLRSKVTLSGPVFFRCGILHPSMFIICFIYEKKQPFFLFLKQNMNCGYSKEPSQRDSSLEHPKHMFDLMCKKIIKFYAQRVSLSGPVFSDVAFCTQQCSLSA